MADPFLSQAPRSNGPLTDVRRGMTVFDSTGDRLGEVSEIFFGTGDENIERGVGQSGTYSDRAAPVAGGGDSYPAGSVGSGRGPESAVPETLRNRLERQGYIRIDTGLLKGECFALSSQVSGVIGERVNLNVPADELIKA